MLAPNPKDPKRGKRTVAILVNIILGHRLSPVRTTLKFNMVDVDTCGRMRS